MAPSGVPRKGKPMTRFFTRTCLAAAAMILVADAAAAQSSSARKCGQRDRVVQSLAAKYGESRQSIGLGAKNQVVETWASDETGTWTITVTHPNGMTCLMASGQAFENVSEKMVLGEDV